MTVLERERGALVVQRNKVIRLLWRAYDNPALSGYEQALTRGSLAPAMQQFTEAEVQEAMTIHRGSR